MSPIIDKRNLAYERFSADPEAAGYLDNVDDVAERVNRTLDVDRGKVNSFTGHLTELSAPADPGFEEPRATSDAEYVAQAKALMGSVAEAIGFAAGEPAEFEADPTVTKTSAGTRVVSLQQMLNGIEVWGMAPKVLMHEGGAVDRVVGDTASVPAILTGQPVVSSDVAVRVAAEEAARSRILHGNFGDDELPTLDISNDTYERLSFQPRNDQPTTFSRGAFDEEIPARLVYLYMGGDVRLVWLLTFSRENLAVQYDAFIEADDQTKDPAAPEILYFYDSASRAISGNIFRHNPDEGGIEEVPFPLPANEYPMPPPVDPPDFPLPWTEARNGNTSTEGNNVLALNGTTRTPFESTMTNGDTVFAANADTPEQYVTNIFYFCNYMHDFFLLLGFTEEAGNFQVTNVTGRGRGADPVQAFAHPRAVFGTANMATRADGLFAVMNMGLVTATGRHTADDGDVVFHEFVHGVTNRLVGGMLDANGLREEQSVAMGEGWGDYFALTIRNLSREPERTVTGNWVTKRAEGIRQRPYDAQYPGRFGDIGKGVGQVEGVGNADLSYREVHDVGEIWCATLMQLTRNLVKVLGEKERGYVIAWQAVVDGLKLTPKNPSFLTSRDAILLAFDQMKGTSLAEAEYAKVRHAAWKAFAKFGMGIDAFCPNASFIGCLGGTSMPPDDIEED
jgi:extracellular elastinolytic metalloproteinase